MNIVTPDAMDYIGSLLRRHDETVLLEMEAEAKRLKFPIVGRQVGVTLELLARSIQAQEVIELGSGFGYSAYWFSRALGPSGQLFCTDGDPDNEEKALDYLYRCVLDGPVDYRIGDAVKTFIELDRDWDIVYNDIDKEGYPHAWRAVRDRIRPGGLYICDNVLWSGRVATPGPYHATTAAILEHNEMIAADERFLTTINPTRDGVLVALRLP